MAHESFTRHEEVKGSSNRMLGLVFATVFVIVAVLPLFSGAALRWWSLSIAMAFAAVAFVFPRALAPLNRAWTRFGLLLHKIVSPIVLGFLFYVVVTPLGLLMRLLGKDPLRLRWDKQTSTYWIERTPPGPKPDTLSDQF
jgi:hypothetical protein